MNRLAAGLVLCLLLSFVPAGHVSADWASSFVMYDGGNYTVTDATVAEERIGERIGKVTSYSDREGTYRGNFSNTFPKGTPYYAITGEDVSDAIAVKTPEGRFITAVYSGEYAAAGIWTSVYFWIGAAAVVLGIMFAAVWLANPKRKAGG